MAEEANTENPCLHCLELDLRMVIDTVKLPVRNTRRAWQRLRMSFELGIMIRTQAPVTVEDFDFDTVKRRVLRFIESLRVGEEDHLYRYSLSCSEPTLYASAYACMTKSMLGALADLESQKKSAWVTYFDSFQESRDGLFYDPVVLNEIYADTDWWGARHLALHMISAYTDLGERPRYPFGFLKPYYDTRYLLTWLDRYDWQSAAIGQADPDNKIMNIGCLFQYQRDAWGDVDAGAAVESLKTYLREKINPTTGMWGGFDVADKNQRSRIVQFACHLFPIFFYDGEFDFDIDRILALVLRTQNRLGGYGVPLNSSACEDIDSVDMLLRLSDFAIAELKQETSKSIDRALRWICVNQMESGGFVFRLNEPFLYGYSEMQALANQGALFPTWLRLLCIASIVNKISGSKFQIIVPLDWSMITKAPKSIANEILIQENEYLFPYHYVTEFQNGCFSQHFVDTWGINYALTLDFIIDKVSRISPISLVDIGCGDGRLTRELSLHTAISKLYGVDSSQRAIGLAKAMNSDRPQIFFTVADITTPHSLGQFDAAVLMEVFEHIPLDRAEDFMRGVRRLVKPNGKLLLTVPHANKALEYKHFQHFNVESLLSYIEPHFKVDDVIPFEKSAWSRTLLDNLLCNRWFVLNHARLLNAVYRYHKKKLFLCNSEANCQRLYVEATAI